MSKQTGPSQDNEMVYMMTNRELSAAIDRTHHLLKNTGSGHEYFKDNITHLKALLEIERVRASLIHSNVVITGEEQK